MTRRLAALLFAVGLATACGTTTAGSTAPLACHVNADCTAGNSCQFAVYGSCGVPGACIANADSAACVPQIACGCDGATRAVCLVNGNATTPIASLGSCDGATQQGSNSSTGVVDAGEPSGMDAADALVSPDDAASEDSAAAVDSSPAVDASDGGSTFGSPCAHDTDCTSPIYNVCDALTGTCSKNCTHADQCPDPPTMGTCNFDDYCQ